MIQKHTCEYTKCINVQALTCEVTASEKLISRFVKRKQPSLPVLSGTYVCTYVNTYVSTATVLYCTVLCVVKEANGAPISTDPVKLNQGSNYRHDVAITDMMCSTFFVLTA